MVAAVVTTYLPTGWARVVSRWSINGRVLGFSEVCFRLAVQRPPFRKVQSTTAATTMWGLHEAGKVKTGTDRSEMGRKGISLS
jgi:hypothetical protein